MSDDNVAGSSKSDSSIKPIEPTAETGRISQEEREPVMEVVEASANAAATPQPSTDSSTLRVPSPVSIVGSLAGLDQSTKKTLRSIIQFFIIFLSCAAGLGIIINEILKQVL